MPLWVRMNFAEPQWNPLRNQCREQPIDGFVRATPRSKPVHVWSLSVSAGGQMKVEANRLFFTKFRCGSSVPDPNGVVLTFELSKPFKFERIHFTLNGSTGLTGEAVWFKVDNGAWQAIAEDSPGHIGAAMSVSTSGARTLSVRSTASEMNLRELSWTAARRGRLDPS